jgi:hypothetical protein
MGIPSYHRLRMLGVLCVSAIIGCAGQKADDSFDPHINHPAYNGGSTAPRVCIDAGHNNSHTADGLYRPFAKLLRADGYLVESLDVHFQNGIPSACNILVIVNAAGGRTYKLFGLNLPTKSREKRADAAFTSAEIAVVVDWVRKGRSILLIADHYPFGSAARTLSSALGVDMRGGFTEADNFDSTAHDRSQLVYSIDNRLLPTHPIITGRSPEERVKRVVTFTGQSLSATAGVPLLILGDSAVDFVGTPPKLEAIPSRGRAQGYAMTIGNGRAVVLGEAAMLTAQVDDKGRRFGMQLSGNDNAKLAINIVHWLSGLLR